MDGFIYSGETFSIDMAEILQITSAAYMRMNDVDLKPVLTHLAFTRVQNINASDKNEMNITNVLNNISRIIEEESAKNDKHYSRRQIFPLCNEIFKNLNFPQTFPVLWEGQMKHPNETFGEEVARLREAFYQSIFSGENDRMLSLGKHFHDNR